MRLNFHTDSLHEAMNCFLYCKMCVCVPCLHYKCDTWKMMHKISWFCFTESAKGSDSEDDFIGRKPKAKAASDSDSDSDAETKRKP